MEKNKMYFETLRERIGNIKLSTLFSFIIFGIFLVMVVGFIIGKFLRYYYPPCIH